jgi:hypothetical protein
VRWLVIKAAFIEMAFHQSGISSNLVKGGSFIEWVNEYIQWSGSGYSLYGSFIESHPNLIKNLPKYAVFHGESESAIRIALSLREKSYIYIQSKVGRASHRQIDAAKLNLYVLSMPTCLRLGQTPRV